MNALLHCLKRHNDAKIKTTEIEKASDTLCQIDMYTDGLEALSEGDETDGLNSYTLYKSLKRAKKNKQ